MMRARSAPTWSVNSIWRRRASPPVRGSRPPLRSEEHTSELQSHSDLVCRLLLEKKKNPNRRESVTRLSVWIVGQHAGMSVNRAWPDEVVTRQFRARDDERDNGELKCAGRRSIIR